MKIRRLLFIFSLSISGFVFSQTKEDAEKITKNYDLEKIKELEVYLRKKEASEKKAAYEAASINGWPITIEGENGSFQELMKLTPDGFPVYYSTENIAAARSTRTNYLNSGGGLGLSLDGQGMIARVWDGGTVRRSHSGFGGRVETVDNSGSTFGSHPTHVTGTIIALPWGASSSTIKGMASQATARTFDWTDDESEALSEATLGMLVSNHSYGVPVTGSGGPLPSWYIGSYVEDSRVWDEIAYLSQYYLPIYSAGNDGNNNDNADPIVFGFDKLVGNKVAKNVLTVANAQDATIAADGSLTSVIINSGSSQGPTDDKRIKPDITGNGTNVTSLNSTNDTSTTAMSGTSMSAPNVTGTLLLLQQHYKNVTNSFMRSATLKGLACHTADDAGEIGPDPVFGWGLLNAKKAAETINNNGLTSWISEERLNQGQSFTMTVKSSGGATNPLVASITWTDVPGEANNGQRLTPNDTFRSLVNDLDIRVTKDGTTYYPWKLNSTNPTLPATRTGDNNLDNVELVRIDSPLAGDYVITITHKGNLVDNGQNYSLIITGITSDFAIIPTSENVELCSNQDAIFNFNFKKTRGGVTNFSAVGIPAGANFSISPASLNVNGNISMTVSNLSSVIPGEYNIGIVGSNGIETETRTRTLKVYNSTFQPVILSSPTNGFNGTSTIVNLNWQLDSNAENYNLQVSTSPTFATTVVNQITINTNYLITGLLQDTMYYWRIIPSNRCGIGITNSATVNTFRTGVLSCGNTFSATDFSNATVATIANSSASVPLNISGGLTIGEIRVSFEMTHTYVQDMTITLQGPASLGSPIITLLEEPCGDNDNINCRFVDSGSAPACSGVPAISGDIAPNDSLSNLNGLIADGTWTLLISDPYNGDGGEVTNFSIEICALTASLSSNDTVLNSLKVYPNPAKGIVNIDLAGSVTGETTYELFDVQGRKVISKISSNSVETLNVENLSDGIYMLSIQNGGAKTTKKLVINK
ncbi:S8 family serine peptidase [Flavobacterium sp. UBA7663]|uniref:S8 family serine peptidase n=1 Tax=Flavobacterium sp. UBA7663 TaxID=1946557 RepID=UPI0025C11F61|nr:S8 family serine peptidase [Flavobacterium sp. UBA7663]